MVKKNSKLQHDNEDDASSSSASSSPVDEPQKKKSKVSEDEGMVVAPNRSNHRRSDDATEKNEEKKETTTSILTSRPLPVVEEPTSMNQSSVVASLSDKGRKYPLIIVLDQATLETVKNKRGDYELLNCDDHRDLCRKKLHKDPNEFRPDILHQELLAVLDSPLNKAGLLKVYIQTKRRVLIDVHPSIRIPRTYKRFAGLMTQLLHKLKIKAGSDSTTLLKVIKNPVSLYLPAGTRCYGMSCQGTLYRPMALARALLPDQPSTSSTAVPTCFVVGAMSTGHVRIEDHPYMEQMISVSDYPLSGAAALSRLMGAIEERWGVV